MLEKIDNCATPANNMAVNNPPESTKFDTDLDINILAATFNAVADAVIAIDVNAHITRINSAAERLTGWKKAEVIGRPVDEIFNIIQLKTRQPVITRVLETLAQGITTHLPKGSLLVSHASSEYIIEATCTPIININNQIIGAVIIFRDITERKKVEQDLKIRTEQFEKMINAAPFGIYMLNQDFRILQINPYALPTFGSTPDLIGRCQTACNTFQISGGNSVQ